MGNSAFGILLIRADRDLLYANPAAREIMARRDCIVQRGRLVHLASAGCDRLLGEFLRAPPVANPVPRTYLRLPCLTRCESPYHLVVCWSGDPCDEPVAALFIYQPHRPPAIGADMLARVYGLTRTETALVSALFSDPGLESAARRCGISVNTAKTHLKHIYTKCGVASKPELMRLLALGPVAL